MVAVRSGETRPGQDRLNLLRSTGQKCLGCGSCQSLSRGTGWGSPSRRTAQAVCLGPRFPSGGLTAGRCDREFQPGQANVDNRRYSGRVGRGKTIAASGRGGGGRTAKATLDPWPVTAWLVPASSGATRWCWLANANEVWVVSGCARGSLGCRSWPAARGLATPANSRECGSV